MFNIHDDDNPIKIAQTKQKMGLLKQNMEDTDTESYLNDLPILEDNIQKPPQSKKPLALACVLLLTGAVTAALLFLNPESEKVKTTDISSIPPASASGTDVPITQTNNQSASDITVGNNSPFSSWCDMPIENLGHCEIPSRERLLDVAFKQEFLDSFAKDGIIQNPDKIRKAVEQMIFIRDQSEIKPDNEFVKNVYQIIRSGKSITLDEALALVEQSNKVLVAGLQNESEKMIAEPAQATGKTPTQGKIRLGANPPVVKEAKLQARKMPNHNPSYDNFGEPQLPPAYYPQPQPIYQAPPYSTQNDYPPSAQNPVRLTNKALVVGDMKKEVAKQNREVESVNTAVDKILSQELPAPSGKKTIKESAEPTQDNTEAPSVFRRKTPVKKKTKKDEEQRLDGNLSEQDLRDIEAVERALMDDGN